MGQDLVSSNKMGYGLTGLSIGGPVGAAFGYGFGGSMDQVYGSYGGDWGDYIWDVMKNPVDFRKKNIGEILSGVLDPGGVFTDMFGKKKKKGDDVARISGKTQDEWVEELGMSDEDFSGRLDEMMRTLSTGAAESRNRMSEIAAMHRLPATSQLAAERAVNIQANQAAGEAERRLTELKENIDRQAKLTAMQVFAQKESNDEAYLRMQEQQTQQQINSLMNMLGQYVGSQYFGSGGYQFDSMNIGDGKYIHMGQGTTYEPYQWSHR